MSISLSELESLIRSEWCRETAWAPDAWDSMNPAGGQCFSTSFVIKSLIGGEIVHAEVIPHTNPKQRHSWVQFPSGLKLDLTVDQFPRGQKFHTCELPEDLVWTYGGKQAELLLTRVKAKLSQSIAEA